MRPVRHAKAATRHLLGSGATTSPGAPPAPPSSSSWSRSSTPTPARKSSRSSSTTSARTPAWRSCTGWPPTGLGRHEARPGQLADPDHARAYPGGERIPGPLASTDARHRVVVQHALATSGLRTKVAEGRLDFLSPPPLHRDPCMPTTRLSTRAPTSTGRPPPPAAGRRPRPRASSPPARGWTCPCRPTQVART